LLECQGKDSKGTFYQWGNQKKYYYKSGDKKSREKAKEKAYKQARANICKVNFYLSFR